MHGKVLIVEDYADWRELLSVMLQREGLDVATAGSLQAAQAALEKTKDLDLAILDVRLVETDESNEDGLRLLSDIRSKHPFVRVIMVTGHGTMQMQRRAFREYKAFDFFRKEQFDSDDFRHGVQEAVQEAARERQQARDNGYMHGHRFERWQKDTQKPSMGN